MKMTMQAMQFHNTNTHDTFSTLLCATAPMTIQVRLEEGKLWTGFSVLLLWCSDEEITHNPSHIWYATCISETRAMIKRQQARNGCQTTILRNNEPTTPTTKLMTTKTMQAMQYHNTNTHETFSTLHCATAPMTIQVRLEEANVWTCFSVLLLWCSDEEITQNFRWDMIYDGHFGDMRMIWRQQFQNGCQTTIQSSRNYSDTSDLPL